MKSGFPGGSLEAYLEEAAGMVVPHRFPNYCVRVGHIVNYRASFKVLQIWFFLRRANRRRSGGKIRNTASTM